MRNMEAAEPFLHAWPSAVSVFDSNSGYYVSSRDCPNGLMLHFRRDLWRNMLPGELVWLLFECISVTVFTFYFIFGEMYIRCFVGNIVTSSRQISGLCWKYFVTFSSLKSPTIYPTLFWTASILKLFSQYNHTIFYFIGTMLQKIWRRW